MPTEILVALLAFAGTLLGTLAGIWQANRLVAYRIQQLEIKVDKHNGIVERMAVAERDLKTAFRLIDDGADRIDKLEAS